jgi:hypothetical protein
MMRKFGYRQARKLAGVFIAAFMLVEFLPASSNACACGCNVFSVGSPWDMPTVSGFKMFLLYDHMDQRTNWSNWNSATPQLNDDKELRSNFYTLGLQFMANRDWGIMIEAPVWERYFATADEMGNILSADHSSLADIRVTGMYTGLSEDMSIGILFGLKLPTGPFNQSLLDRDAQIGTGTTDMLLGGYQMGQETGWGWYAQALYQHPLGPRDGYRPGDDFDFSAGVHYDNLANRFHIVPMLQLVASLRGVDSGPNSDPDNTGYQRLYAAPGIEVIISNHLSIFGDLKIPVFTHVRGYQLIAPALSTVTASYSL